MSMTRTITLLSTFIVVFTLGGCKSNMKSRDKAKVSATPLLSVECVQATEELSCAKISFATSTEALRSVTIEPRVNGYMELIRYAAGEPVKRGAVIFRIDPSQLNTQMLAAEASLESAQADLVEAYNNYQRAIPLVSIDAISKSQYDAYVATYRAAEANVKYAQQTLENTKLDVSYSVIRAPFSGLIGKSPANLGDYVGPGTSFTTLTTIEQVDTLMVDLAIPTAQYLQYADNIGADIDNRLIGDNNQIEYRSSQNSYDNRDLLSDITVILADSSVYRYKGDYYYTKQSIADGNSTVVIVATVPNPESRLKSNMFTRVSANIGSARERVLVPQIAVTQMQGVNSVWIIKADSTAEYRTVELGATYGDMWHITKGIEDGEMVAATGLLKIHQGLKVAPKPYVKSKIKSSQL